MSTTAKIIGWIIKTLVVLIIFLWGLLGALPGGKLLQTAISIVVLYKSYIVHAVAWSVNYDMTAIDQAIAQFMVMVN